MLCSYIVTKGKYKGFRCDNLAEIDGYCEDHEHSRYIGDDRCLFIVPSGKHMGLICNSPAIREGFCNRCYNDFIKSELYINKSVLNMLCSDSMYNTMLYHYLNKLSFTQSQLNDAMKSILRSNDSLDSTAKILLLSEKFVLCININTTFQHFIYLNNNDNNNNKVLLIHNSS